MAIGAMSASSATSTAPAATVWNVTGPGPGIGMQGPLPTATTAPNPCWANSTRRVAPACPGTGNGPVSTIEWPGCVRPPPPTGFAPTSRRSVKAKALRPGGFFVGGRKGALRFRKPEKSRPPTEALPLGASSAADSISPLRSAHRFSFEPALSRGSASFGPRLVYSSNVLEPKPGARVRLEALPAHWKSPRWERARGNEALRSWAGAAGRNAEVLRLGGELGFLSAPVP